jgi:hypothetical protein
MIEMLKNKIVIGIIIAFIVLVVVMEFFVMPKCGG